MVARSVFIEFFAVVAVRSVVYAERNIGRLLLNGAKHGAGLVIEAERAVVVAYILYDIAHYCGNIGVMDVGSNLAEHHHHTRSRANLDSYPCGRVSRKDIVKYSVGNLVAHLIGMSFRHAFRCKKSFVH